MRGINSKKCEVLSRFTYICNDIHSIIKGHRLDKILPKSFFNGGFVASDLRQSAPKPKIKVTIEKRDDKSEVEKQLDTLLESLVALGQNEKAFLIQKIYEKTSDFSMDLINKIDGKDLSNEMSATDATAFLLRLDLSKDQYQTIRKESSARKLHFLPPYKHVQEEKEKALPKNIKVTETSAEVPLKDLMIKTFHRHMEEKSFKKMIYQLKTKNGGKNLKLHMYYKSGYDVASGQSKFKVSEKSLTLIISKLVIS